MEQFEAATLELRKLCERYAPGSGGFAKKPILPSMDVTGSVEAFGYGWLHITINTLLPHCRYQSPNWFSDTIRRLLDSYEACGKELPFFERAMLIIDEHTAMEGRHIFDQDNKGWKAVSNAIKGRLIPDDDQHTLAVALPSSAVQSCLISSALELLCSAAGLLGVCGLGRLETTTFLRSVFGRFSHTDLSTMWGQQAAPT